MSGKHRVVTLIASATEIVAALGCLDRVVGRSHECDFPAEVLKLPKLTEPKFSLAGSSGEIDQKVRALVAEGLSVYRVDAEALHAIAPDVIVTQDHCDVCAVSLSDVEKAVASWAGSSTQVVSLRPDCLDDVYSDIRKVAAALEIGPAGDRLVAHMQSRFASISAKVAGQAKPGVAFIEWGEPLMSGGNWMPTLIGIAGGRSLFGKAGGKSETMTFDELAAADADIIVIAPCGYDLAVSVREHETLRALKGWDKLRAVRNGQVFAADGNAFFNRPGPRLVESAEIFAEIFHAGHCRYGHEGTGWVRV